MKDYRLLSSLCYFSIFFAGFIFPLIVYFIVKDDDVKYHAKRALISHIIPLLTIISLLISLITLSPATIIGFVIIAVIMNFFIVVWNIIQGIKVFT
ncbi:MAG: DUF4870 domain-containing protein [Vulcanibacillus sp.]